MTERKQILEVKDLKVYYHTDRGSVRAVDGVSFNVQEGENFGIIGESGCGKSTMAMALLRLVVSPGMIEGGQIFLNGTDILTLDRELIRKIRWSQISFIPQGAMNSLNPVMRIGSQIADVITTHQGYQPEKILRKRIQKLLSTVGLPHRVYRMYPHELSGGMKQRVCIAMAITLEPEIIIADEPTSALDVVVQRVVMQTLLDVQERLGAALVLIGHDMGIQAQVVNRQAVMYAGKIVEIGEVKAMYKNPLHPYTKLLIKSLPTLQLRHDFQGIPGLPPSLLDPPKGCAFSNRCPYVMEKCREVMPKLVEVQPNHFVACYLHSEVIR
ncbi:ABC transporter ATP-binding protein [bacterium]|nr:ABC transporter ATP-binding protein [bacterium]